MYFWYTFISLKKDKMSFILHRSFILRETERDRERERERERDRERDRDRDRERDRERKKCLQKFDILYIVVVLV